MLLCNLNSRVDTREFKTQWQTVRKIQSWMTDVFKTEWRIFCKSLILIYCEFVTQWQSTGVDCRTIHNPLNGLINDVQRDKKNHSFGLTGCSNRSSMVRSSCALRQARMSCARLAHTRHGKYASSLNSWLSTLNSPLILGNLLLAETFIDHDDLKGV